MAAIKKCRLYFQEYLKSYEEKLLGTKETETWMLEVKRLESIREQKSSELETLKKESHDLLELNDFMRREVCC